MPAGIIISWTFSNREAIRLKQHKKYHYPGNWKITVYFLLLVKIFKKMIYRVLVFLVLNFAALGIGRYFMGEGPSSDWYRNLNQAPWTPPGWIFGVSWTIIMICFALYMAYAWQVAENRKLVVLLFFLQWIVNILWNPVFFKYHQVFTGL